MKDSNINNKFAGWIEDFLTSFAKTTEAAKETVAEININDLDKVVWNDETFYVYFDETGASVINVFGNIVTTLDGVTTLDDVNKQLNSKQIVSSVDETLVVDAEMENEIEQALSSIADVNDDQAAQEYVESYNEQNNEDNNTEFNEVQATLKPFNISEEKTAELIGEKLAEMEERLINTFEEKMNAMMEQMYARINPGNVYDMGEQVQREEVLKFTDEAAETEQQIAQENAVDRTTVDNRYSTKPTVEESVLEENVEEVEENTEEVLNEEITEEVFEEEVFEEEVSDEIEVLEEFEAEEVTEDILEIEEIDEEQEVAEEIVDGVELEGDDAEVFKEAKCPYCATSLSKTAMNTNSIEVTCDNHSCGTRYSVDVNTGKIYII